MMALKKKTAHKKKTAVDVKRLVVDAKRFAEKFAETFGRPPTGKEFEEWCVAWGGRVEKDKCVFALGIV